MSDLTNEQLITKAREYKIPLVGIFSKDELPKHPTEGCYIINLQSEKDGNGTHWTCFLILNKKACYFDSFGFPSPVEVERFLRHFKPFPYNRKEIQNINSGWCGLYCLAFLHYMITHREPMPKRLDNFCDMWSDDTCKNLTILKNYLSIR